MDRSFVWQLENLQNGNFEAASYFHTLHPGACKCDDTACNVAPFVSTDSSFDIHRFFTTKAIFSRNRLSF